MNEAGEAGSTNALFRLGEELLVRLPPQPGGSATISGRLLAQMALPDEVDEHLLSPASARGRKAAQTRWARQARKGLPGGAA